MDFNASYAADLYSDRAAHSSWQEFCLANLCPEGKDVADIGCGGGIYTLAFVKLGAKSVVGIDISKQYIEESKKQSSDFYDINFLVGDATATGLEDSSIDLVFERALIHHFTIELQEQNLCEVKRILRKDGVLAVQDRTIENIINDDPKYWIRSTLFDCFPELLEFEKSRRLTDLAYVSLLKKHQLEVLKTMRFSEVRKVYKSFEELKSEILMRKGKSILFELSDKQLQHYCIKLEEQSLGRDLVEIDEWTIWRAVTT